MFLFINLIRPTMRLMMCDVFINEDYYESSCSLISMNYVQWPTSNSAGNAFVFTEHKAEKDAS